MCGEKDIFPALLLRSVQAPSTEGTDEPLCHSLFDTPTVHG